jgi:hypothetical protein
MQTTASRCIEVKQVATLTSALMQGCSKEVIQTGLLVPAAVRPGTFDVGVCNRI